MNDNNNIDWSGFISFIVIIAVLLLACSGVFKDDTHKSSYSYSNSYKPSSYKPSSSSHYNSSYKPSGNSYSSSHSNNYLDFDPDDYDDPSDFADDAEDYFGDWDTAYDYWENY